MVVGVLAVVLVATALVVVRVVSGDETDDVQVGGPVGSEEAYATGAPLDVRRLIATAAPSASNRGDETAVLESVAPVRPPNGLEVVETFVVGPDANTAIPQLTYWPDPGFTDLHPVRGYRLAPDSTPNGKLGIRLGLVMRVPERKQYQVPGVWLTYRVAQQRYRVKLRHAFTICGGPGKDPPCEPPPDY